MRRAILVVGALAVGLGCSLMSGQTVDTTKKVQLNGQTFTLPAGFEIELVAGPPLVDRPIVADFDEQGRLYVADSSGSNEAVKIQLEKKPHRIVRLEDSDGDGKFDKSVVFADKMMFPEGVMWHAGSLYVSAPPSIWKLTDTDGDGAADKREEWFDGKTLTGCANDLHGPYRGPDGWIYWAKGAFAQQTYERPGKKPFVTKASHLFRARPDGTGIEPVMTGGMDNPVDVVFTPGGERIFTTTFFQQPAGGKRDGLIHAVYGGIYGKDHHVIHDPDHKWSGPDLMPVLTHMGAAAPCGLARYESSAFGVDYQDNLFACQFNLRKVSRHVLSPSGTTFTCKDEDFLVSDSLDFHPTDVLEDADGSLLVIDTGGWYKLCCPTSQLHKPDVFGAIYRVKRKGAPRVEDPRGRKIKWDSREIAGIVKLLDDPRPAVRHRAVERLGAKAAAVPDLAEVIRTSKSVEARRNAVWAATRIDHADARAAVRRALADSDDTVRQVALHSVSLWRDRDAASALQKLLVEGSTHNQRAAAEALGRIGDRAATSALLDALDRVKAPDRVLEHSLTYALIEIGDERMTVSPKRSNPNVYRAILTALDQREGGKPDVSRVVKELSAGDAKLRETAWWLAGRHPEWGDALAGIFRERLTSKTLVASEREDLPGRLARFAAAKPVQDLLAERLTAASATVAERKLVLKAMAQASLKEAPDVWLKELPKLLAGDEELLPEVIATARVLRVPKGQGAALTAELLKVAGNEKRSAAVRIAALDAVPGAPELSLAHSKLLVENLAPEQQLAIRLQAANVLARAKLPSGMLLDLASVAGTVGPMEAERLLEAFAHGTDERVGTALVASLKESKVRDSLRVDVLKQHLAKYPARVQKMAEELYALIEVDAAKQREKLEKMLTSLKDGDIRRGQKVFHGEKGACSACHALGYLGGKVGPDLTHIARTRGDRDLLEAIVFPNASLVRSYEPVLVTTKDGKSVNGLVRGETSDEIVLVTGANQEVRVARKDIDEMQPSKVSVMPSGLDQQLTPQELADLVAFLKACK